MRKTRSMAMVALAAGVVVGRAAWGGTPSNDEQLWLEIINRMRINPAAELGILVNINPTTPATWGDPISSDPGVAAAIEYFNVDAEVLRNQWKTLTPVAPLAWNNNLHSAAAGHNTWIIDFDEQSHQLPGEPDLGTRFTNAGYNFTAGGENVYAYTENVFYGHAGFVIDWGFGPGGIQNPPGHRANIMSTSYREVGIAITPENNEATEVGPLVVTQDFGKRSGNAFVTGVIYGDSVSRDNFYTPGEGMGGVTVRAVRTTGGTPVTTTTWSSGGYSLQLAAGTYDITFTGGGLTSDITYKSVVMGSINVKLDSLSQWIADDGKDWATASNWSAGVPNGPGTVASLAGAIRAPKTITLNSAATVGTLNLESAHGYTITGFYPLSLNSGGGGPARINVLGAGDHVISTIETNLDSDATVDVPAGSSLSMDGILALMGKKLTRTGGGTVNLAMVTGGVAHGMDGTLEVNGGTTNLNGAVWPEVDVSVNNAATLVNVNTGQDMGELTIAGAKVSVAAGGDKVVRVQSLNMDSAGIFDLNDNDLIVVSDSLSEIEALVASGRAGGAWTGKGIVSSTAATDAGDLTGLAVALNNTGGGTKLWADEELDAVIVKFTWHGDSNIDGVVNALDYFNIDSGFLSQGEADETYAQGDFNFDGVINALDYFMIDSAFLGQGAPLGWASVAAVPEPGVLMAGMVGMLMLRRRRR